MTPYPPRPQDTVAWDDFCDSDGVRWEEVEVGGFSMGAQSAMYISYMRPGDAHPAGNTIGVLALDAGAPNCGAWDVETASATEAYYPDEFDDHGMYPPCGVEADTADTGAVGCPEENRFVMMHAGGSVAEHLARMDLSLEQVGISSTPVDIDTEIVAEDLLDTNGQLKDSFGTLLLTDISTGNPHGSMAADANMVAASDTGQTAEVASDVYLMPLYLQALCELDQ